MATEAGNHISGGARPHPGPYLVASKGSHYYASSNHSADNSGSKGAIAPRLNSRMPLMRRGSKRDEYFPDVHAPAKVSIFVPSDGATVRPDHNCCRDWRSVAGLIPLNVQPCRRPGRLT